MASILSETDRKKETHTGQVDRGRGGERRGGGEEGRKGRGGVVVVVVPPLLTVCSAARVSLHPSRQMHLIMGAVQGLKN